MAGLATQGLAIGGTSAAVIGFGAAAAVMVTLMFAISAAVASAQEGLLSALKASGPQVKRWGAFVMISVGVLFGATSAWPALFIPFFSAGS